MLNIDETCITNLVRDELGTWYGQASYDGTTIDCSWDADTPEEHADERSFAVLNVLDNLRVCTVSDMIAEGRDITLTDGDVIHAIRAAERIGDDDIEGLLGHAWCRGLLTGKGLTTDEKEEDEDEVETPATRTQDICDQLTRYGGAVDDPDLLDALWALTDVNDDLWHCRDGSVVVAAVDRAIGHLENLKRKQVAA